MQNQDGKEPDGTTPVDPKQNNSEKDSQEKNPRCIAGRGKGRGGGVGRRDGTGGGQGRGGGGHGGRCSPKK